MFGSLVPKLFVDSKSKHTVRGFNWQFLAVRARRAKSTEEVDAVVIGNLLMLNWL